LEPERAKLGAPMWYEMWAQDFPESETSPEGLILVHNFQEVRASCRGGNSLAIAAMTFVLVRAMDDDNSHMRNFSLLSMSTNIFALLSNMHWIPRAEQAHGILYAHRLFVRINVVNVLFFFCVAILGILTNDGDGDSFKESASQASPLLCVMLSGFAVILVGAIHLAMVPLTYRAVVHVSAVATITMAPSYSQLRHVQESLIALLSLALGEVIGMTVQRMIRRSFAATRAVQADHRQLASRLEEIDAERRAVIAEKEILTSRLEQIDAEKERLTYEVLLEQQRGATASHTQALGPPSSSYGSESELLHAAETLSEGSRQLGADRRSADRSPSPAEVVLSASMRMRLNASLGWLEAEYKHEGS
jgi:hypothetical protein